MRFLTLIMLFLSTPTFATQLTYRIVDSLTYIQFTTHRYSELKKTGKEALHQKIDFFYLRMRLGIAYYEEQNYENSLPHFVKANSMNPADTVAQEYLYYSFLYTNRIEESKIMISKLSPTLQKRIGKKKTLFDEVALGGGYDFNKNIEQNKNNNITPNQINFALERYNGNTYSENVFLKQAVSNRIKLYYGFSNFTTQTYAVMQNQLTIHSENYSNNHQQYNLAGSYSFNKGWNVSAGLAYYKESLSILDGKPDPNIPRFNFYTTTLNPKSLSGSLTVGKRMRIIQVLVSMSVSNFGDDMQFHDSIQYQGAASLVYYPFGNTRFFGITSVALLNNGPTSNIVYSQVFGGKLKKWMWYELNASYGNMSNFITHIGFVTYNTSDPIQFLVGANLKIFWRHFELNTGYYFQQREAFYTQNTTGLSILEIINYKYSNHLITTTLKWNF